MSNLNTVDPNALETVTGGARILSGSSLNNNNNFLLQSTVNSLHDLTRGLRSQNSGPFGGSSLFGGNGLVTALLFSRLLGPRPF
jgi:hypothetical protein